MRNMSRRVIFGAVLASLAGTGLAISQPMGPGAMPGAGPGGGAGMGPGGGQGRGGGPGFGRGLNDPATYLAGLKTELGITPAQEPAWTEYADTVQGVAGQMQAMHTSVFASMQTATWQERRDMMNGMFASRDAAHGLVRDAANKLLPSLTPAQKAKAATTLPGLMSAGPPAGRGPGMGPGMGMGGGQAPQPAPQPAPQ
jgi:hypothetical protein